MSQTPKSDQESNQPRKPDDLPSPKRGAIPTPKTEIEKATPYVPGSVPTEDDTEEKP